MQRRIQERAPLPASCYDAVIIGGGINGVAIARECALGGKRVLLLERNDFASGTTSRSTRIIHGGLRYLEHGELSLVRESLRERERLLFDRPHLVRPMRFVLALGCGRRHSALEIRTGLWLYRKLAGSAICPPSNGDPIKSLEAVLDKGQRWSLFDYDDAQCEFPERLVAEWLIDAAQAGAEIRNHCKVLRVDIRDGCARGVIFRDLLTGLEASVEASWIVNATGPWADSICHDSGVSTDSRLIGGVRGSHIVLDHFVGAPDSALYTEASDGRPIFVIPWNGQYLVGTTEVPDHEDPSGVEPTIDEVEYLLSSLNQLFPAAHLGLDDIQYAFAGIRPLPYSQGVEPSAVTRRHLLHDHEDDGARNMLSIIGGKLTTAAALARDCARHIGIHVQSPPAVFAAIGDASGIEATINAWGKMVSSIAGITPATAQTLARTHGRRALCVAQLAGTDELLRSPICEHSDHIVAEAFDAMRYEHAVTLADVLLRRVPVALSGCWDHACARAAADRIGRAVGWDQRRIAFELEEFELERQSFLKRPSRDPLRRSFPAETVA